MSLRGTAFFLLAGLLLGGCESCRDSGPPRMSEGSGSGSGAEELIELEPNNDAAQATRLLVGKRTSGAIDAVAADIDYFFIQSSEGPATLTVTVSAPTIAEIFTAEAGRPGTATGIRFVLAPGAAKLIGPFAHLANHYAIVPRQLGDKVDWKTHRIRNRLIL